MPATATITEKCDRLAEIHGKLKTIVEAAKTEERPLSDEERTEFDGLSDEGKGLKDEIAAHKADKQRLLVVEDFEQAMDEPRPAPLRDAPDTQKDLLDLSKGRYSLRHFVSRPGQPAHEAHASAYKAGLLMLARCGTGASQEWALHKCRDANLNVDSLAPYQGEDGNASGGFLVFPEFERTLINLKEQYGVFQQNAYRIPMASSTLTVPRRAGGLTVYYPDEHGEITASAMKFDQVMLTAKKYAALTQMSTELNEDSVIAMIDILVGEMAYAFAKAEDTNGFIGTGTSAYCGTVGLLFKLCNTVNGVDASGSVQAAVSGNTTIATLDLADWEKTVGLLPVYAEGRAKWYMSKSAFWAGPAALIDAAGGNTGAMLSSGASPRFLGYDVVFVQVMPTASTATGGTATSTLSIPAVLGDLNLAAYLGTRRGVSVQSSDQRYFEYDQIGIKATQRVAVNNVVGDAEAPATAAGPVVALQLASS